MNVINNLDNFTIDGVDFSGIGRGMLKCTNQLNYKKSPGRQSDGSMTTINNPDSFLQPAVEIGFKLIPINLFWKLRQLLLSKRVFNVTYYDVDFNEIVTHQMYAHPDELKDFLNRGEMIIGVQDFKITMIATLLEPDLYTVTFTEGDGTQQTRTAKWGRPIKVPAPYNRTLSGKNFLYWKATMWNKADSVDIKLYNYITTIGDSETTYSDRYNVVEDIEFQAIYE